MFKKLVLKLFKRNNAKKVYATIMFTDIKSSSILWKTYNDKMFKTLVKFNNFMTDIISSHKGRIVKTIGDAFMVVFDIENDAIDCAIKIQQHLKNNPFILGNKIKKKDSIKLRIGIASGYCMKTYVKIYKHKMVDYFGGLVNTASRMESKVADVGGIAYSIFNTRKSKNNKYNDISQQKIDEYEKNHNVKFKKIIFRSKCNKIKNCENIEKLHGVGEINVYKIKIK